MEGGNHVAPAIPVSASLHVADIRDWLAGELRRTSTPKRAMTSSRSKVEFRIETTLSRR
jgi:hypothetical protein